MSTYEEVQHTVTVGTITIKAKIVSDDDAPECPVGPDNKDGCNGTLHLFERGRDTRNHEIHEEFKDDPMAFKVQKFEHSGRVWSLAGEGPQCQWDTSPYAGVWVCDGYCKENYDTVLAEKGEVEARAWLLECARLVLEEYTSWAEGDVWGVVVTARDEDDDKDDDADEDEACWGFIGRKYAEEELKDRFDAVVALVTKRVEKRTQRLKHWLNHHNIVWLVEDFGVVRRFLYITRYHDAFKYGQQNTAEACVSLCNTTQSGLNLIVDLDGKGTCGDEVPFKTGYVLVAAE